MTVRQLKDFVVEIWLRTDLRSPCCAHTLAQHRSEAIQNPTSRPAMSLRVQLPAFVRQFR